MKLSRIRTSDGIKPAACDADGQFRDLSSVVADITPEQITPAGLDALGAVDLAGLRVITGDYAPFLGDPGRVFCIGLNFYDHAEEMNMPIPEHPIMFMKACDITGANDPIVLPIGSEKTDWEVELGIVIGSPAKNVAEAEALDHHPEWENVYNRITVRLTTHSTSGLTELDAKLARKMDASIADQS